jgi:hypothetical protein
LEGFSLSWENHGKSFCRVYTHILYTSCIYIYVHVYIYMIYNINGITIPEPLGKSNEPPNQWSWCRWKSFGITDVSWVPTTDPTEWTAVRVLSAAALPSDPETDFGCVWRCGASQYKWHSFHVDFLYIYIIYTLYCMKWYFIYIDLMNCDVSDVSAKHV